MRMKAAQGFVGGKTLIGTALIIVAVCVMVSSLQTREVYAGAMSVELAKKVTVFSMGKSGTYYCFEDPSGKGKIKGMKSSKKSVVKPLGNTGGFFVKKPGKATLTMKVKKNGKTKSFKCKMTVKKYKNANKHVLFGDTDMAARFNKKVDAVIPGASKPGAFTVVPKKGWTLKGIFLWYEDEDDHEMMVPLRNGSLVDCEAEIDGKSLQFIEYKLQNKKENCTLWYYACPF